MSFKAAALRPTMISVQSPGIGSQRSRCLSTESNEAEARSPGSARVGLSGLFRSRLSVGSPTLSVTSDLSYDHHDIASSQSGSKRSLLGSPMVFLRKSMKVRAWSKSSSEPSSPYPDMNGDVLAEDAEWSGEFPGISVGHLQSLMLEDYLTVSEVLAKLVEQVENGAYALNLDPKERGPAHSVVLMSDDMRWSDFVATLSANFSPARRVWIQELCEWVQVADWKKEAVAAIGNVDIVLPSWANPSAFWTPEHIATCRTAAKYRVLLSPQDKAQLAKAMSKGLSLSYFDDLLSSQGNLGAKAVNAVKSMLVGLLLEDADLDEETLAELMGHIALAVKNYEGAIGFYKTQQDFSFLAEAYRRAGNLESARSCLKLAVEGATNPKSRAHVALIRCRVLMELGQVDHAIKIAKAAQVVFDKNHEANKVAECCMFLADAYTLAGNKEQALANLHQALSVLSEVKGSSATIAHALHKTGLLLRPTPALGQGNEAALRSLTEALFVYRRSLGDCHPSTLECEADKAKVLLVMDNVCEASDLLRHVNEQYQFLFGAEDSRAMAVLELLADALILSGSHREAQHFLEHLCESQISALGASSDAAVKTAKRVACMRINAQDFEGLHRVAHV